MKEITYAGIRFVESPWLPKKPRLQLSQEVPVPLSYRIRFNEWAREFFGEEHQIYMVRNQPREVYCTKGAVDELAKKLREGIEHSAHWLPDMVK